MFNRLLFEKKSERRKKMPKIFVDFRPAEVVNKKEYNLGIVV